MASASGAPRRGAIHRRRLGRHALEATRRLRRGAIGVAVVVAAGLLAGCYPAGGASVCDARAPGASCEPGDGAPADELAGTVTVYAAASLSAAFDQLAEQFEQRYPSVEVAPGVYDGSRVLATQIVEGAPADVFASADERTMQLVVDAGRAESPELFATNTLVIAVPTANPADIAELADLSAATVVLCAPEVPCGAATQRLLDGADVEVEPVSLEQSVTAVLTKVETGEADAGLVYATDARGTDAVTAIVPEGAEQVVNRYPITVLADAANPLAAEAFVDFVLSDAGQGVLAEYGFGAP